MMEGWKCPGCGRCYSPFTQACGFCGPQVVDTSTTQPLCSHDYDYNRTVPACRKCGAMAPTR